MVKWETWVSEELRDQINRSELETKTREKQEEKQDILGRKNKKKYHKKSKIKPTVEKKDSRR